MIEPSRTPSPTPPGTGRPQRASDADRAFVSGVLHQAVGMGMLTLDEADDRLAAVYAAVHRDDLARLIDDLPVAEPAMGSTPAAPQVDRWERMQAATWRGAETAQQVLTRSRIGAWLLFLLVFMIILSLLANMVPMGGHGGGGMPGGGGGMHGR